MERDVFEVHSGLLPWPSEALGIRVLLEALRWEAMFASSNRDELRPHTNAVRWPLRYQGDLRKTPRCSYMSARRRLPVPGAKAAESR
jgi:hypothetical protein